MAALAVTFLKRMRVFPRAILIGAALTALGFLPSCGDDDAAVKPTDASTGPDGSGPAPFLIDGGGEAAALPDGAGVCPAGPCNYQTQQGCSSEQSCLPALVSGRVAPSCQAAGTRARGESCDGWNDCASGLFCAEGTCRKLCCGGDWTACASGESCTRQLLVRDPATDAGLEAGVDLCFPVGTCDLFDPDACSETGGRSCQIVDLVGNVACGPRGEAAIGEACGKTRPCRQGLNCVDDSCRRLCGSGAPPCPSAEGTCVHFVRHPPGVGECTRF